METPLRTVLFRLIAATIALACVCMSLILLQVPGDLWTAKSLPIIAEATPGLAASHATSIAAAVPAFADARGKGRTCDMATTAALRVAYAHRGGPIGVPQVADYELVTCRWPRRPYVCAWGMSEYDMARWSHYVDFVEWAPTSTNTSRSFTSPRSFLVERKELGIERGARVAILVHLYVTEYRPWNADLYHATDDEILWWIGSPAGVWWMAVDEDTLLIGRVGRDEYVIWDASSGLVYALD